MKKRIKKVVIAGICTVLGIGTLFLLGTRQQKYVTVVPIMNLASNGGMSDSTELQGTITTDVSQRIDRDEKKPVKEIHVKEGDRVKKGDPLITYDFTLQGLELEMKRLDKQNLELQIQKTEKDLKELKEQKNRPEPKPILPDLPETEMAPPHPEPEIPQVELETETQPETQVETQPETESNTENEEMPEKELPAFEMLTADNIKKEEWLTGDGSFKHPYVFMIMKDGLIKGDFFNTLMEEKAFFRIEVRENNDQTGIVLQSFGQSGAYLSKVSDDDYFLLNLSIKNVKEPETNETEETFAPMRYEKTDHFRLISDVVPENTMPNSDINQQIRKKEAELSGYQLDLKDLEFELQTMSKAMEQQMVTSSFNGVVKKVGNPNTTSGNNEPLILVTGSEGYCVIGEVPETQLNLLKKGAVLEGFTYENNVSFTAEVESVSPFPIENTHTDAGQNASMYAFKAYIAQTEGLKNNESTSLTLTEADNPGEEGPIVLEKPFVRFENGRYFVYKADERSRLKKQYVTVSRIVGGYAYEITEGLSYEDQIAFPYGKWTIEGARTKSGEMMDLY